MSHFSGLKGTKILQDYKNLILVDSRNTAGGASNFINQTTSPSAQTLIENLPKQVMANLQPEIKLFKVVYKNESDKSGTAIPLPINNMTDPMNQSNAYLGRNPGHLAATIKEFSWDYLGTNPAEVDYYINCRLKLWFSSTDAFNHRYPGSVSFRDLIARPIRYVRGEEIGSRVFNHKFFRIRVDVEYPTPTETFVVEACAELGISRTKLLRAIREAKVSFFLNILKHDFSLVSDVPSMPFELDILYNGAVESALWDPTINLIRPRLDDAKINRLKDSSQAALLEVAEAQASNYLGQLQEASISRFLPSSITEDKERLNKILQGQEIIDIDLHSFQGTDTDPSGEFKESFKNLIGKDYNRATERVIFNYYKARQLYKAKEAQLGVAEYQTKTEAYGRLINELNKKSADGQGNRIHTVGVPQTTMQRWWSRKNESTAGLSEVEYKRLVEQEEAGDVTAKERLKDARQRRRSEDSQFVKEILDRLGALDPVSETDSGVGDEDVQESSSEAAKLNELNQRKARYNLLKTKQSEGGLSEDQKKELTELSKTFDRKTDTTEKSPFSTSEKRISWIYFGDILDAAIDILRSGTDLLGPQQGNLNFWSGTTNKGKTRLILGDVEYYDVKTGKKKFTNLAQVPISLELFQEWWFDLVIRPQREKLSFRQFLQAALSGLIQEAFATYCAEDNDYVNGIRTNIDYLTVTAKSPRKPILRKENFSKDKAWKAAMGNPAQLAANIARDEHDPNVSVFQTEKELQTEIRNSFQIDKEQEIMYVYSTSTVPFFFSQGRATSSAEAKRRDVEKGVLYLEVGVEGTPIKDISFEKVDIPFYNEARGERSGFKDSSLELSNVYNAKFRTLGNTAFRPGRHLYIRLPHFGNPSQPGSVSRLMGIGGYFMVNTVSNTVRADGRRIEWDTSVDAIWQAFGAPAEDPPLLIIDQSEAGGGLSPRMNAPSDLNDGHPLRNMSVDGLTDALNEIHNPVEIAEEARKQKLREDIAADDQSPQRRAERKQKLATGAKLLP